MALRSVLPTLWCTGKGNPGGAQFCCRYGSRYAQSLQTLTRFSPSTASVAGGSWGNTCANGITVEGHLDHDLALSNERPRFRTIPTRKVVIRRNQRGVRFNSTGQIYGRPDGQSVVLTSIGSMPSAVPGASESLHRRDAAQPLHDLRGQYSRWSFSAGYLRQGMEHAEDASKPTRFPPRPGLAICRSVCSHNTDVGTGFDWTGTGQCMQVVFNNMNGQTVHIDQLRRPPKATPILVVGFDASGYSATDENLRYEGGAAVRRKYGMRSYCTMTIFTSCFTAAVRRGAGLRICTITTDGMSSTIRGRTAGQRSGAWSQSRRLRVTARTS